MPNYTNVYVQTENLPDEAKEILNHLHSTGTGVEKLRRLDALAKECKSLEEFIAGAKQLCQPVTFGKIEAFLETKLPPKEAPKKSAISAEKAPSETKPEEGSSEPSPSSEAPSGMPSASNAPPSGGRRR